MSLIAPAVAGASTLVYVRGVEQWQATGVILSANEWFVVEATGCIKFAQGDANPARWPDGCLGRCIRIDTACGWVATFATSLAPNVQRRYALVGRIGASGTPFEIDTLRKDSAASAGELFLASNDDVSPPPGFADNTDSFTVTITTCLCPKQGDMDGSGVIDVQDVLAVIRVAFVNETDVHDYACPRTRGDVNNDGVVDVNDVLYIIKTAFTNGPPPVDPCAP
jgi:hypothetical protein